MTKPIKSPLNYIGGKTKLLPQLLPLFPDNITTFVEPFCGGYNVGINVKAERYFAFDVNSYLVELLQYMKDHDFDSICKEVEHTIDLYGLSLDNQAGYNKLRSDYNASKNPGTLFVLICYCFNHQIRFNNKLDFNTPFGKARSEFNENIKRNLKLFCEELKKQEVTFASGDFIKASEITLDKGSFVYCDPPYFITTGSYNDGTRGFGDWTDECDQRLIDYLDELNSKGIKFGLSNVFVHKGQENTRLKGWAAKYNVHIMNMNYNNSNYHSSAKEYDTIEVFVTNY